MKAFTTTLLAFAFIAPYAAANPYGGKALSPSTYEVPVPAELEPYARFPVEKSRVRLKDGELEVKYMLPLELTGLENHLVFRGTVDARGLARIENDQGTADCNLVTNMCHLKYKKLNFDLARVADALRAHNFSPEEFDGRLAVAARLGGEMEGNFYFTPEQD